MSPYLADLLSQIRKTFGLCSNQRIASPAFTACRVFALETSIDYWIGL